MPKVIQVIEAIETRGEGIVGNPCRSITCYYTLDGAFLAEADPEVNRRIEVKPTGEIVDHAQAKEPR